MESIYAEMRYKLYGVCLISAWDLAKGYIPASAVSDTNVVIIDSGGYEANVGWATDASNMCWSDVRYRQILTNIDDEANVVAVNYDRWATLEEQIKGAMEDVSCAPGAASDFLIKPTSTREIVNIPRLCHSAGELNRFDILGIAAREIGNSFIARCRSIVMLRDILGDAGLDIPIHVFGAISPAEVLTYFFCGADIFDGLNWLRYAYRKSGILPMEEAVLEDMKWNQNDYDLHLDEWTNNLTFLYRLQQAMRHSAATATIADLCREFPVASEAARIAEIAGAEVPKGAN